MSKVHEPGPGLLTIYKPNKAMLWPEAVSSRVEAEMG